MHLKTFPVFRLVIVIFYPEEMASNDGQLQSALRPPPLSAPIPVEKDADYYNMEHKERGLALIFNHENFEPNLKLKSRSGGSEDCKKLKQVLEIYSFKVQVHSDLTHIQIIEVINKVAKENHKDRDGIVVAVLSCGQKGNVYAKNCTYNPVNLWKPFAADKCPTLAAKPKLFFIQACPVDNSNAANPWKTEPDSVFFSYKIPVHSDFLIAYCTCIDSRFMQAFCKELEGNGSVCDILAILSIAKQYVSENPYIICQLTRIVKLTRKTHHSELSTLKDDLSDDKSKSNTTVKVKLLKQLTTLKLIQGSINENLEQFIELTSQLSAIEKINDGMKVCFLLMALPETLGSMKIDIEEMNIPDEMKYQILLKELKVLGEKEKLNGSSSVLAKGNQPFSLIHPPSSNYSLSNDLDDDMVQKRSDSNISSPSSTSFQPPDPFPPPSSLVFSPNEIDAERKVPPFPEEDESDDSSENDSIFPLHIKEHQKYNMDFRPKGLVLIIANETYQIPGLPIRKCCDADIKLSVKCFKNLGFDVRTLKDMEKKEIIHHLEAVSQEDHSERGSLAIIVSTHGYNDNHIYASDGTYHIKELFKPFQTAKCGTLAGKPKLYFMQYCRGENSQSSIALVKCFDNSSHEEKQSKVYLPAPDEHATSSETVDIDILPWPEIEDDFLVFFSTTEDHMAFQNVSGSWFISSLCKGLTKNKNCDILHILTFVNRDIAINYESDNVDMAEIHEKKQMSEVVSKLQKFLILS